MTERELLRLTEIGYETAADPALWSHLLKGYAEAVAADVAIMQVHHLGQHRSELLATSGLAPRFEQSYNNHYSKLNLWREHGQRLYVQGHVLMDEELCPRRLLLRSEFYHDYLRPMGGVYCTAAVIKRHGDDAMMLTALRGECREPFDEPERKSSQLLLPHLTRAQAVQEQLHLLKAGESVLDSLPVGVGFLTAGCRAIYWNRAAEQIFRSCDGLLLREGMLCATDRIAHAELRRMVQHSVSPSRSLDCPAAALIPRPSFRRSYQVVAAPLLSRFHQFLGLPAPAAVVLITDPEQQQTPATELLKQLYGLTPKEADVTAKLAVGKTVQQAAEDLQMRYETARTHLRRIFSKTGTSRQAELVILVGQLPRRIAGV